MRVYLNRTLPCFSEIVLAACLSKVGHSAGAPLGAHVLNSKGLKKTLNTGKLQNNTGKVGEICQSESGTHANK